MARIRKTSHYYSDRKGYYTVRELTRSFDTLEAAEKFAEGKQVLDIYKENGRFKVQWLKEIDNNE